MKRKVKVLKLPRSPDGVNFWMNDCMNKGVCAHCSHYICKLGDWPGYCQPALPKIPTQLNLFEYD